MMHVTGAVPADWQSPPPASADISERPTRGRLRRTSPANRPDPGLRSGSVPDLPVSGEGASNAAAPAPRRDQAGPGQLGARWVPNASAPSVSNVQVGVRGRVHRTQLAPSGPPGHQAEPPADPRNGFRPRPHDVELHRVTAGRRSYRFHVQDACPQPVGDAGRLHPPRVLQQERQWVVDPPRARIAGDGVDQGPGSAGCAQRGCASSVARRNHNPAEPASW